MLGRQGDMGTMKKIYVLFKTHLDIGFTDMAQNVTENYLRNFLPNAMKVARQMRGERERFIWTTGSWLIWKYLEESQEPELLEDAIRHGEVRWHGLPFTTHTECMNRDLFEYGASLSRKLDERFGRKTIAAKMTDVPGHTIAMVPLLAAKGIRFLHIGVNPASTRPDVPTMFWWQAPGGERLLVMYNNDYGQLTEIGDSGAAVYFAHTGDNCGPQSPEQIRRVYADLHAKYPEAELVAGTLEDVAEEALKQTDYPMVTQEIGDSWIHGIGTDPRKMSQFRGLLRLQNTEGLSAQDKEAMNKELLLVPEHTWGLDEKTWLGKTKELGYLRGEYETFLKEDFVREEKTEKFQRMEESWGEQRAYVERAAKAVSKEVSDKVRRCMAEYRRDPWDIEGYTKVQAAQDGRYHIPPLSGWGLSVDGNGAICSLRKGGKVLADESHRMAGFSYEVFSREEYADFLESYQICHEQWAYEDFDKIGMEKAISHYQEYLPQVTSVWHSDKAVAIRMALPEEAVRLYGGMGELETVLCLEEHRILIDFAWWGKEATRVAEGSWLAFTVPEKVTGIRKLGSTIDPGNVVLHGNRRLHATDGAVSFETISVEPLDSPLVSVGERALLKFPDTAANLEKGIFCNLHNNVWGTNFPMWYGEDARFRFIIHTKQ